MLKLLCPYLANNDNEKGWNIDREDEGGEGSGGDDLQPIYTLVL